MSAITSTPISRRRIERVVIKSFTYAARMPRKLSENLIIAFSKKEISNIRPVTQEVAERLFEIAKKMSKIVEGVKTHTPRLRDKIRGVRIVVSDAGRVIITSMKMKSSIADSVVRMFVHRGYITEYYRAFEKIRAFIDGVILGVHSLSTKQARLKLLNALKTGEFRAQLEHYMKTYRDIIERNGTQKFFEKLFEILDKKEGSIKESVNRLLEQGVTKYRLSEIIIGTPKSSEEERLAKWLDNYLQPALVLRYKLECRMPERMKKFRLLRVISDLFSDKLLKEYYGRLMPEVGVALAIASVKKKEIIIFKPRYEKTKDGNIIYKEDVEKIANYVFNLDQNDVFRTVKIVTEKIAEKEPWFRDLVEKIKDTMPERVYKIGYIATAIDEVMLRGLPAMYVQSLMHILEAISMSIPFFGYSSAAFIRAGGVPSSILFSISERLKAEAQMLMPEIYAHKHMYEMEVLKRGANLGSTQTSFNNILGGERR